MHIEPFGVEIWMNEFETVCELNLAETCVESITIAELLALAGKDEDTLREVLPFKMTYGDIQGSDRLRDRGSVRKTKAREHSGYPRHDWRKLARAPDTGVAWRKGDLGNTDLSTALFNSGEHWRRYPASAAKAGEQISARP